MDRKWNSFSSTLTFERGLTLQTADIVAANIKEYILDWEIKKSIRPITTDNAADMMAGMHRLYVEDKSVAPGCVVELGSVHVRCMAHGVSLAVRECRSDFHDKITKIRRLVSAPRSSVKR